LFGSRAIAKARQEAADRLVELQGDRARIDTEGRRVAAQIGPARFLAAQLGTDAESVIRWLVALLMMLVDPCAVVLDDSGVPPPLTIGSAPPFEFLVDFDSRGSEAGALDPSQ